jgi:hypothetical protein
MRKSDHSPTVRANDINVAVALHRGVKSNPLAVRREQNITYSISGVGSAVLNREITGLESVAPRPVLSANPTLSKSARTIYEYFNTAVVGPALKGSRGADSGPYLFNGPGTNNFDASVFKNVPFTKVESRFLQLRCEMYNSLNHTQFSGINTSATLSSTGAITNLPRLWVERAAGTDSVPSPARAPRE